MSGTTMGAEALLRWRQPDGEVHDAGLFIETAEQLGLIVEIGHWTLVEACRQVSAWRTSGVDVPVVAVNLSVAQVQDIDLVDHVTAALDAHGVAPQRLRLEIRESALRVGGSEARHRIERLHDLGVRIALDRFGSGDGDLTELRDWPVDVLKVDRSLTARVADDDRSRRLLAGVVALAGTVGADVVAEGVETEEQADALVRAGCRVAQGFHVGRPGPPDRVRPGRP